MWELLSKAVLLAFLKAHNFLQNYTVPWQQHDRLQVNMLFRRSAATTRAHQEEAIRRRKSGRNSLRADRHRRRTGQAGREDFAKFCLSGCSAQECRERSSLRRSRTAVLPSGCDALRHILLGIIWRIAGGRFAASLHRVAPTPRTAFSAWPQKGEMVSETYPTQWPRWKARHL